MESFRVVWNVAGFGGSCIQSPQGPWAAVR